MNMGLRLFERLEIETCSMCNRFCVSCLRNSNPDKEATAPWFEKGFLPTEDFRRVLQQSKDMGFRGEVCLSHYNEPLMDPRIVELAQIVKDEGFPRTFFGSNGDHLTEELAKGLDGLVDHIGFSLYMEDPIRSRRRTWIASLFKRTKVTIGDGDHMVTHFSPLSNVVKLGRQHSSNPCSRPLKRLIINHRGEMLMCCDDMVGNFGLGTIHESSVAELWNSERHQHYVNALMGSGGRKVHPHCLSCPRP
jgi:radical SAM protein with 4Fe4S-binding SPASM domain